MKRMITKKMRDSFTCIDLKVDFMIGAVDVSEINEVLNMKKQRILILRRVVK